MATEQEVLAAAAKSILDYDVTKAEEIAIFVNTIGACLEGEVEKLFTEGNRGLGYVLDIFGSTAVEPVANKCVSISKLCHKC